MHCHFLVCHSYVMNSFPCHLIALRVISVANIVFFPYQYVVSMHSPWLDMDYLSVQVSWGHSGIINV
jgi:hypothetical protein